MLLTFIKKFRLAAIVVSLVGIGFLMSSAGSKTETSYKFSNSGEVWVYICVSPSAYAYHDSYCSGLNRCTHEIDSVLLADAKLNGRTPCGYCYK